MPAPDGSGFANTTTNNTPASLVVTMAASRVAVAGNLLIAVCNSDATHNPPSGYALAVSAVNAQGLYIWTKTAAGGETSVTFTPTAAAPCAGALLEMPSTVTTLDKTASATRVAGAANQATGTTTATDTATEFILCAVGPHGWTTAPTTPPTWTNSLVSLNAQLTTGSTTAIRAGLFLATKDVAATGTQTSTASWTNNSSEAGGAIATFRIGAASAPTLWRPRSRSHPSYRR